ASLTTQLPGPSHGLEESFGQPLRQVGVAGLSQIALYGEDDLLVRIDDQERRPSDRTTAVRDGAAAALIRADPPVHPVSCFPPGGGLHGRLHRAQRLRLQEPRLDVRTAEPHEILRRGQEPSSRILIAVVGEWRVEKHATRAAIPPRRLAKM